MIKLKNINVFEVKIIMENLVLYIHGKGGNSLEEEH